MMHKGSKDAIKVVSNFVISMAVLESAAILIVFLSGDRLGALLRFVVLCLVLWVFFKLLDSHKAVIAAGLERNKRISKLEEKVKQLEAALQKGQQTPRNEKQEKMTGDEERGFVHCPNPDCRQILKDTREKCWKCGTELKQGKHAE